MKAFTERNPKVVGIVGGRRDGRLHPGHPLPQPEPVQLRLHHRRPLPQRGRHLQGHRGHGGRRQRRGRSPRSRCTATPSTPSSRSTTRWSLPHVTTAAVEVETLLGVVDVTLKPVSGWADPLKPGALITDTSVPTEFYQLQNTAHSLLSKTNAQALNSLVTSLANITKDKQTQVAQIISGLGALTTTVDQRSGQVSQLIDSANTLSSTLAGAGPAAALGRQQPRHRVHRAGRPQPGPVQPHHQRRRHGEPDQQPGEPGLAGAQLAAAEPARRPDRGGPAPGRPGPGRQLPRRRAQGLPVHRLQREHPGDLGQHLRQPGVADQHLRRHRALRGARPGPEPGARARPGVRATRRPARCRGRARTPSRRRARRRRPPRTRRPRPSSSSGAAATTTPSSGAAGGLDRARTRGWAACPSCSARCCRGSGDGRAAGRAGLQGPPLRGGRRRDRRRRRRRRSR